MTARWRVRLATVLGYGLAAAAVLGALAVWMPVRVAGRSMHPALHAGDLVLVRRGVSVAPGDVALLAPPGHGAVLHRVLSLRADGSARTRGDANAVVDFSATPRAGIVGRVVAVVPVGRAIERWRGETACDTLGPQPHTARR